MKSIIKFAVLATITLPLLASCSGGGSSSAPLFGSLPSEYAEMVSERDALKEKAKDIKTEAEKAELIAQGQELDKKWSAKLESTAKGLDGKQINLTDSIFKVTAPVSLTFKDLKGNDLEARFTVNGSAETIAPATIEDTYSSSRLVFIAGYDAAGNELFKSQIGKVAGTHAGTTLEIPAGAQVEFTTLQFNDNYVDKYPETKTLKLII